MRTHQRFFPGTLKYEMLNSSASARPPGHVTWHSVSGERSCNLLFSLFLSKISYFMANSKLRLLIAFVLCLASVGFAFYSLQFLGLFIVSYSLGKSGKRKNPPVTVEKVNSPSTPPSESPVFSPPPTPPAPSEIVKPHPPIADPETYNEPKAVSE